MSDQQPPAPLVPPIAWSPPPPKPPVPLTALHWGVGRAWAITAFSIVCILVCGGAAGYLRYSDAPEWLIATQMGLLLCAAYLVPLLVVWVLARKAGFTLRGALGLRRFDPVMGLAVAFAAAFAARMLAGAWGALLVAFEIDLPGMDVDPTQMLPPGPIGVFFTVVATVLLAPVVEEIVFRGVLLSAFNDRFGVVPAIAVSSAAFGLMHVAPAVVPAISMVAVILGVSFVRSRTLWMPIAIHMAFNGIGVGLLYALRAGGYV